MVDGWGSYRAVLWVWLIMNVDSVMYILNLQQWQLTSRINILCIYLVFFTGHITCSFFCTQVHLLTIYKYSYSESDKHNNNNLSYNHFHTQVDIINRTCFIVFLVSARQWGRSLLSVVELVEYAASCLQEQKRT